MKSRGSVKRMKVVMCGALVSVLLAACDLSKVRVVREEVGVGEGAGRSDGGQVLCRLVLNVSAGSGLRAVDLEGMSVCIYHVCAAGRFDFVSGFATDTGGTISTVATTTSADGRLVQAILLPEDCAVTLVKFTLADTEFTQEDCVAGRVFTWKMEAESMLAHWDAGTEYVFDLELRAPAFVALI